MMSCFDFSPSTTNHVPQLGSRCHNLGGFSIVFLEETPYLELFLYPYRTAFRYASSDAITSFRIPPSIYFYVLCNLRDGSGVQERSAF